jgi:hypothetical protein
MKEAERNIPEDVIKEVDSTKEMWRLRASQAAVVWGMRGIGLYGFLQLNDKIQQDFFSVALPFDDLRTYAVAVVSSTMILGSAYVRGKFEKQKQAKRFNAINREIVSLDSSYSPPELPEGHLEQYRGDVELVVKVARQLNNATKRKL